MANKDLKEPRLHKADVLDRISWKRLLCKGSFVKVALLRFKFIGKMNVCYHLTQVYLEKSSTTLWVRVYVLLVQKVHKKRTFSSEPVRLVFLPHFLSRWTSLCQGSSSVCRSANAACVDRNRKSTIDKSQSSFVLYNSDNKWWYSIIIIIIIIRKAKIIVTLSREHYRGTLQSQ